MNKYKNISDFYFSESGDFFIDEETKDLLDTRKINYRGLIQKIHTIVASHKGEWNLERTLGASIDDFRGRPNNSKIGAAKDRDWETTIV